MQLTHLLPYTSYTLVSYTSVFFLHIKSTYTLVSYTSQLNLHIKRAYTLVTYTSLSYLHIILCLQLKTENIYLHILAQLTEYCKHVPSSGKLKRGAEMAK